MLFLWTSFLKDEVLDFLDIGSSLNLSNIVAPRQRKRHISSSIQLQTSDEASGPSGHSVEPDSKIVSSKQESCKWEFPLPNGNFRSEDQGCIDTRSEAKAVEFDPRAIQDIASQELLLPTILEHDKMQREYLFRTTLFTCQVCFMEKLGELCMSFLGCDHVYCKECMKGYFEVQIDDGNVQGLSCPSDKCESQAHPAQVSFQILLAITWIPVFPLKDPFKSSAKCGSKMG